MKRRSPCAITTLATSRLLSYSEGVVNDTIEFPQLSIIAPELESYRRYFLKENGDLCLRYRLSVLLISIASFAQIDDGESDKVSDFIARYSIFNALVQEIANIQTELASH